MKKIIYWKKLNEIIINPSNKYKKQILCECICGLKRYVNISDIKYHKSTNCGCMRKPPKTHGMSNTPTHRSWASMIQRCRNKKSRIYKYYGGRGIIVCKRWNKFENFYKDMGLRPNNTSLDRINNNGNYNAKNCRWASREEQRNNTRNNIYYTYKNKKMTLTQIAKELCVLRERLHRRIRDQGKSLEQAIQEVSLN